jgi:hypothetical protein
MFNLGDKERNRGRADHGVAVTLLDVLSSSWSARNGAGMAVARHLLLLLGERTGQGKSAEMDAAGKSMKAGAWLLRDARTSRQETSA